MTATKHIAAPRTNPPAADLEALRTALPLTDPDRHDLEDPRAEAAFAALAAAHPERVTPAGRPAAVKRSRATTPTGRTIQADAVMTSQLRTRLTEITGRDIAEVRITKYHTDSTSFWTVMCLGPRRREVPLPKGGPQETSSMLRTAFPDARWSLPQDYDTTAGTLTEHRSRMPAPLAPTPRQTNHDKAAAAARTSPGTWFPLQTYSSVRSVIAAAHRVRTGYEAPAYTPTDDAHFEARREPLDHGAWRLWIRYVNMPAAGESS
ncbi:hypothetical protein [Streptomyces sp. CAU 1734]|uniref:hypothetical protein n=1 Tax=Streptomyces sp. CAU 1734 TaxID=3140360 RepID=UPI003260C501